jgi:hypothetical protein
MNPGNCLANGPEAARRLAALDFRLVSTQFGTEQVASRVDMNDFAGDRAA